MSLRTNAASFPVLFYAASTADYRDINVRPFYLFRSEMPILTLKEQEIPFDAPASVMLFLPHHKKPFVATRAAVPMYGEETVVDCLGKLQQLARDHHGIDYLQVFECPELPEPLWFIDDGDGGAITALLPSDY